MKTTTGKLITAEEFARMPDPLDGSPKCLSENILNPANRL